jgi:transposase-like protein
MVKDDQVKCPKCKSDAWKYAKDPLSKKQRYRCKNLEQCGYQFVPGRPQRIKKYPSCTCPKCGSAMTIFKHLSDGYRLRCNRHNAKGSRKCTHKINVPFPGKAFKIAKDSVEAIKIDKPAIPFCWSKMDFSKETVSIVAYLTVIHAIPAPQVAQIMSQLYNLQISHETVTRWTHKAALNLHKNLGPLQVPYSPHKRLFTDETQFRVRGQKRWVWAGKDSKFDSIQTFFISPRRCTEYARSTLNIAFENSPSLRKANVVTDGLHSYPCALDDLGYETEKRHIRYVGWDWDPVKQVNNNRLERQWSDCKTAAKAYRGFKSDLGLWSFVANRFYRHNYFMPNKRLAGKTPAETIGKKLPYCHDKLKLMMKFL